MKREDLQLFRTFFWAGVALLIAAVLSADIRNLSFCYLKWGFTYGEAMPSLRLLLPSLASFALSLYFFRRAGSEERKQAKKTKAEEQREKKSIYYDCGEEHELPPQR